MKVCLNDNMRGRGANVKARCQLNNPNEPCFLKVD